MESARIFRGWQGAAARHSGDYGEEPQRGQPRKRPPTSHANFRDTTLAAATATAQQDVPQRRTDAITAIRLDEMRSEEHTSELQSLMRTSYAVFCLKTTNIEEDNSNNNTTVRCSVTAIPN